MTVQALMTSSAASAQPTHSFPPSASSAIIVFCARPRTRLGRACCPLEVPPPPVSPGRAMKSGITTTAWAAAAGLLIRAVARSGGSGSSGSGRSKILAARAVMLVLLLRMVSALRRATLGAPQNRLRSYVERHCVSFDPSRANRSRRASKGEISLSTITEEECCHR